MMDFRPLLPTEADSAYALLVDTVAWLAEREIRLWRRPLPREVYDSRQARGENYGLFVDGQLAVIVSLVRGVPDYWTHAVSEPGAIWLCTLATGNAFRGRGLGQSAVSAACERLAAAGEATIYLDCKPGFLAAMYQRLGFAELTRGQLELTHAPGTWVEAVLMSRSLAPGRVRCGEFAFGSADYQASVALRHRVLRAPLGLDWEAGAFDGEERSLQVGAWVGATLVGSLVLKPVGEATLRMRQVAVATEHQRRGVGQALIAAAEALARARGYARVEAHARQTALGFYEALRYRAEGEGFTEIGLPHRLVVKKLG